MRRGVQITSYSASSAGHCVVLFGVLFVTHVINITGDHS